MSTASRMPDHADLEFARNERTGTVHVLPYTPERWQEDGGPALAITGETMALVATARTAMLCGRWLHMRPWGTEGDWISEFPDDDICSACVRALGDQSARAFEHPQGGELAASPDKPEEG